MRTGSLPGCTSVLLVRIASTISKIGKSKKLKQKPNISNWTSRTCQPCTTTIGVKYDSVANVSIIEGEVGLLACFLKRIRVGDRNQFGTVRKYRFE